MLYDVLIKKLIKREIKWNLSEKKYRRKFLMRVRKRASKDYSIWLSNTVKNRKKSYKKYKNCKKAKISLYRRGLKEELILEWVLFQDLSFHKSGAMIVKALMRYKFGRKMPRSSTLRAQQLQARHLFKEIYLDIKIQDMCILLNFQYLW